MTSAPLYATVGAREPIHEHLVKAQLPFLSDPHRLTGRYVRSMVTNGRDTFALPHEITVDHADFPALQSYYTLSCFYASMAAMVHAPFHLHPVAVEFNDTFQRAPGELPLWIEPDLDYATYTMRFSVHGQRTGMVHLSILLHEAAHFFIRQVIAPHRQTGWLSEAACDYFAAAFLGSPDICLTTTYPQLRRTLQHTLQYPADVQTTAQWLQHFYQQVLETKMPEEYPDVVQRIDATITEISYSHPEADQPQPHSIGLILGGFLWALGETIEHQYVCQLIVQSLVDVPKPSDPFGWIQALVASDTRLFDGQYRAHILAKAAERGLWHSGV